MLKLKNGDIVTFDNGEGVIEGEVINTNSTSSVNGFMFEGLITVLGMDGQIYKFDDIGLEEFSVKVIKQSK